MSAEEFKAGGESAEEAPESVPGDECFDDVTGAALFSGLWAGVPSSPPTALSLFSLLSMDKFLTSSSNIVSNRLCDESGWTPLNGILPLGVEVTGVNLGGGDLISTEA